MARKKKVLKKATKKKTSSRTGRRAGSQARVLAALVRFTETEAKVRRLIPVTRPPSSSPLHAPAIHDKNWTRFPPGASEIVASFHDRKGRHLASMAWWGRADFFGERYNDRLGQHAGNQAPPRFDDRMLHTEVPARAVFLVFHRIRVEPGGPSSLSTAPSSLPPGTGPRPIPGDGPWGPVQLTYCILGVNLLPGFTELPDPCPDRFPLPFLAFFFGLWKWLIEFLDDLLREAGPKSGSKRNGWVNTWETIHDGTSTSGKFHIIILGDGYTDTEQSSFDSKAKQLADGICSTEPFLTLKESLRITIVRCVSYESGITRCTGTADCTSAVVTKKTYFETEGCWVNPADPACLGSSPTYMGVKNPDWVYAAADPIAAYDKVGLYIILANVDVWGGSAFRSQKIAFVPAHSDADKFIGLGTHESAHVLADLMEEYTPALPWDGSTHQNVVEETAMKTVWWEALADPNELQAGELKRVYTCPDDPADGDCDRTYNDPNLSDAEDPGYLGLFWGAQYIDADEDPCAIAAAGWDSYTDKRGNHFYRPQARCRMRYPTWEFCRVCSHDLSEAIRAGLVP